MKENLLAIRERALTELDENPAGYETVEMSIDEAGATALMANLTNFYFNAPLAILREYVSNAIDSHRRVGQTKPVLVTIPDVDARYADEVIVQDFGIGMSKEDIIAVYSKFGASTKTTSGSEIGKFGLGAKSALAAASRFDIIATKDGITTTAYVKKNVAGVGKFFFVSEVETGAPNGVKITIPVIGRNSYSASALDWFFVGLSPAEIKLSGNPIKHVSVHDLAEFEALSIAGNPVAWVSTRSRFNAANNQLHVNVGGVHYALGISHISAMLKNSGQQDAVDMLALINKYTRMLVLNAPMSSLTLHPAREDLIYDEVTVNALGALIKNALVALNQHVQSQLNRLPDRKAALEFTLAQRKASLPTGKQLTYRGEVVPSEISMAGWYHIPTTFSNEKSAVPFKVFKPTDVLPPTSIMRTEVQEYNNKGLRLRATPVSFAKQQAIRVKDATLSDVAFAQKQLMKTFEELRFPSRKVDAHIWFTDPTVQLDEWTTTLITEELSFEEFKQQVRAEQARRRAEAIAAGVPKPPKDAVKFAVLRNLLVHNPEIKGRDDYRVEMLNAEQIRATQQPVIIAHKDLASAFAFSAPTAASYQNTISDWHSTIELARYYRPDALIVAMPAQAKTTSLAKRFPRYEMLEDVLLSEAKRVEATSGRSHIINDTRSKASNQSKYRLGSFFTYASRLSRAQLEAVRSEDTRYWLNMLHHPQVDSFEDEMDGRLLASFGYMLDHSSKQGMQLLEAWRAQADRYPLVMINPHKSQIDEQVLDDFILYINAVDSVR